jgi:hypothetical protein
LPQVKNIQNSRKPEVSIPEKVVAVKNPVIPGLGVCDPHIHIFQDRAYLYASHDHSPDNKTWDMRDWHIWSSDDLVTWKFESAPKPEDFYLGSSTECWAPDAATKDGKYYFYFSEGNRSTGVAVSNQPGGPFVDALGKPLLDGTNTPTTEYDPAVFVDDDGSAHIMFGGPAWAYGPEAGYFMAELNPDMISLKGKPRKVLVNHDADDKASLHKKGDTYYLSWASFYATSKDLYGPYEFRGNVGASPDHGSFFSWKNQDFIAFTVFDPHFVHRATGISYLHYRDNGEMVTDGMIVEFGVGQYQASWNRIEAEWYMQAHGCQKQENPRLGFDVKFDQDGQYLLFPNIRQLPEQANLQLYASVSKDCAVEIRSGGPEGPILGVCELKSGFMAWRGYTSFITQLDNNAGDLDLCLVFRNQNDGILLLDWFNLS